VTSTLALFLPNTGYSKVSIFLSASRRMQEVSGAYSFMCRNSLQVRTLAAQKKLNYHSNWHRHPAD